MKPALHGREPKPERRRRLFARQLLDVAQQHLAVIRREPEQGRLEPRPMLGRRSRDLGARRLSPPARRETKLVERSKSSGSPARRRSRMRQAFRAMAKSQLRTLLRPST